MHQPTYYLSAEAADKRLRQLRLRIAAEYQNQTWLPDSDFWKLPVTERQLISAMVMAQ